MIDNCDLYFEMVLIGFIDEPKGGATGNDDDPSNWTISRIGGQPAYHNQELIAEKLKPSLVCSKCQQTQTFVCQLYCPLTGHQYDRTLYLFACRNLSCWNTSNSWTTVRCQKYDEAVEKEDEIMKPDNESSTVPLSSTDWCNDADEWNTDDEDQTPSTTVKTQKAPTKSEPDRVLTEQVDSIKIDDERSSSEDDELEVETSKKSTKKPVPVASVDAFSEWKRRNLLEKPSSESSSDLHFPFYYIDIDDEQTILDEARLNEQKKWKNKANKHQDFDEDDDDETSKTRGKEKYEKTPDIEHGDVVFYRFQQKIRYAPDQIIRYDKSGTPLILTKLNAGALSNVQKCRHCQSACSFEFQLMPALVNYLKIDQKIALEFGTVFVYTCSENCWNNENDLFRLENAFVQADPDQNLFD